MSSKNLPLAEDFLALFAGLHRSHGRYVLPKDAKADDRGKLAGKGWTAKGALTAEDWVKHLSGEVVTVAHGEEKLTGTLALGVTPIREDSTTVFGAIDVDVYPIELKDLAAEVAKLSLPLVLCRTKSGGAHLYLFLSEPAPAELVRSKLLEWSVLLGYPGVEVFPKQTRLANEHDDGNWINIPYSGGARTTRYALKDGKAIKAEAFVEYARSKALTVVALEQLQPTITVSDADEFFLNGPPCLQVLARRSFPEGSRNNALFDVAIYLKKRYGDEFGGHLSAYNERFMDPPLPQKEIADVIKSVGKKNYSFRCKEAPIAQVCNRQVCVKREFGVGGLGDDPGVAFGELVKLLTEPPVWIWDVNGARIELTTDEIMNQRLLHGRVIETLNMWPTLVNANAWQKLVREKLASSVVQVVPEDATKKGQLWVHLSRFCTSRVVGRSLDELLLGKPYTDVELQRTYFCSSDFLQYLSQHRFSGMSEKDIYRALRDRGVDHHYKVIKGKGVNYWSVPQFNAQTEDFAVPRAEQKEAM